MIKGLKNYTNIYIFLFSTLFISYLQGQKRIKLPQVLNENSGLIFLSVDSCLWINDSGNPSEIIQSDINGKHLIAHSLKIHNIDWEDLTYDDMGNIYIADIGDNYEKRRFHKIYKLSKNLTVLDSITFEYDITQNAGSRFFDAEAIAWWNGELHIFTKGITKRKSFSSHHFSIGTDSSIHLAKYIESIDLENFVFTGAALSPDRKTLAISAYRYKFIFGFVPDTDSKIYFFDVSGNEPNILSRLKGEFIIPTWFITRQYESIDYLDDKNIILAAEKTLFLRPMLRKIKIPDNMR